MTNKRVKNTDIFILLSDSIYRLLILFLLFLVTLYLNKDCNIRSFEITICILFLIFISVLKPSVEFYNKYNEVRGENEYKL
jgi:hypothetical protein